MTQTIGRRSLLRAGVVGAAGLGFSSLFPAWAQTGSMGQMPTLSGEDIHLKIANTPFTVGGRNGHAVTMNGHFQTHDLTRIAATGVVYVGTYQFRVESKLESAGVIDMTDPSSTVVVYEDAEFNGGASTVGLSLPGRGALRLRVPDDELPALRERAADIASVLALPSTSAAAYLPCRTKTVVTWSPSARFTACRMSGLSSTRM